MRVSVSILNEKENYVKSIEKLNQTDADFLHLDIMDGSFTLEKSFSLEESKKISNLSKKKLDVHIMSKNLETIIDEYISINPYNITFHLENNDVLKYIYKIKSKGIKASLAINPYTDIKEILPYLDKVDMVLVMSVIPGKCGQKFMEEVVDKLKYLKEIKNKYSYEIEIDGGINLNTISLVKNYADIVVSGSFITNSDDYNENILKLKE